MLERLIDTVTHRPGSETRRLNRTQLKQLRKEIISSRDGIFEEPLIEEYRVEVNSLYWQQNLPVLGLKFPELAGCKLDVIGVSRTNQFYKDRIVRISLNFISPIGFHMSWIFINVRQPRSEISVDLNVKNSLASKKVDQGGDISREIHRLQLAKEVLDYFKVAKTAKTSVSQ